MPFVPCSAAPNFPPYSEDGEQVFTLRRGEGYGVSSVGGGGGGDNIVQ